MGVVVVVGVTCAQVWVGGMGVGRGGMWQAVGECGSGFVGIPFELGGCTTVHGTLLVRAKPSLDVVMRWRLIRLRR